MAKIDASVQSSCERMGELDAGFVDGVWRRCAESVQGEKKFKGKKKRDGAR